MEQSECSLQRQAVGKGCNSTGRMKLHCIHSWGLQKLVDGSLQEQDISYTRRSVKGFSNEDPVLTHGTSPVDFHRVL